MKKFTDDQLDTYDRALRDLLREQFDLPDSEVDAIFDALGPLGSAHKIGPGTRLLVRPFVIPPTLVESALDRFATEQAAHIEAVLAAVERGDPFPHPAEVQPVTKLEEIAILALLNSEIVSPSSRNKSVTQEV